MKVHFCHAVKGSRNQPPPNGPAGYEFLLDRLISVMLSATDFPQSAAAADSLSQQAARLLESVSVFRLEARAA